MQITAKRSSKFTKKITHIDDMMIHIFVKYSVQTRLRLWDIKITNFLKFVIFISHKQSWVWRRYFTRLCIIISSTYAIFSWIIWFFCCGLHEFSWRFSFHQICSIYINPINLLKNHLKNLLQYFHYIYIGHILYPYTSPNSNLNPHLTKPHPTHRPPPSSLSHYDAYTHIPLNNMMFQTTHCL